MDRKTLKELTTLRTLARVVLWLMTGSVFAQLCYTLWNYGSFFFPSKIDDHYEEYFSDAFLILLFTQAVITHWYMTAVGKEGEKFMADCMEDPEV